MVSAHGRQFLALAAGLGFSPAEAAAWVADCTYAAYVLGELSGPVALFSSAVTGYVNTMLGGPEATPASLPAAFAWPPDDLPAPVEPGIDARRQRVVERIKASKACNPLVMGPLLGTENTGAAFHAVTYVAQIRSAKENGPGQALVAFSKADGHLDGVNLYLQRAGDAAPVLVGRFTRTPALDPTPVKTPGTPEERTYTVVGVIHDQEIGQRSAAVSLLMK